MSYARAQFQPRIGASARITDVTDPLQTIIFRAALLLLFLHFSMAHELVGFYFGIPLYLMFVLIPLCIGGTLLANGLSSISRNRAALCWIAFTGWALVSVPFSTWPGGSVQLMTSWLKGSFGTVLVYSGVITTWKQVRTALSVIALAVVVNVFTGRIFIRSGGDRIALEFGTMGNANDFAAHLLLVICIVLFIAFNRNRHPFVRICALLLAGAAMYLVLGTGSRGAIVAICAAGLLFLIRGTQKQRLILMMLGPVGALALLAAVPTVTRNRLFSFSQESMNADPGALQSTEERELMFRKSILHTLTHPLLGVGPGQFGVYEGQEKVARGGQGMWFSTHNSFTQISSECGIPALIFFCTALYLTWRMLSRVWREAGRLGMHEMSQAALWLSLGFTAFTIASIFLNLGYSLYFPTLSGLAFALQSAFEREAAHFSANTQIDRQAAARFTAVAVRR